MRHFIWVSRVQIAPGVEFSVPEGPGALFALDGECHVGAQTVRAGGGAFVAPGGRVGNRSGSGTTALVFGLSQDPPGQQTLACEEVQDLTFPRLLRLDEVSFPPGAIAYRHTHPGPGLRYLRQGALHLQADHHAFDAAPGDVWFEPAESPVRATASEHHEETRFVRFMALPTAFLGKPTINILDPEDAARPKRQTTQRHVDRIFDPAAQTDAG